MKAKPKFTRLDSKTAFWTKIVKDYPKSKEYASLLHGLQQQRAELANLIGRKNHKNRVAKNYS